MFAKVGNVSESILDWESSRTVYWRRDKRPNSILLLETLSEEDRAKFYRHELGRAIDLLAGQIPVEGLSSELKRIYHTRCTGEERERDLVGPADRGYRRTAAARELIAAAISCYMANPNTMKTIAPNTARRIRAFVNTSPELSRIIRFN